MTIAVLGAGSWGTALARLLGEKGHEVRLWDHDAARADEIQRMRENTRYLPGAGLPAGLAVTASAAEATDTAGLAVLAVPSAAVRGVLLQCGRCLGGEIVLLSAAKGLEPETGQTVSEVCREVAPDVGERLAVLSGPNLATELARGIPTATVIAAGRPELAASLQAVFQTSFFRPYTTDDVVGVELGGALKNIIAIAAGISDGLGYGDNTKASLLTRGLAEMVRLGVKRGARSETFRGLSGMGDMIATCAGRLSRNYRVGMGLAEGKALDAILAEMGQVAEGVPTARAAVALARRADVDVPVIESIHGVLFRGAFARDATAALMERAAKGEIY
jgi:glycerol-3-phosphate dehydrogenase (NAD(P)+)